MLKRSSSDIWKVGGVEGQDGISGSREKSCGMSWAFMHEREYPVGMFGFMIDTKVPGVLKPLVASLYGVSDSV